MSADHRGDRFPGRVEDDEPQLRNVDAGRFADFADCNMIAAAEASRLMLMATLTERGSARSRSSRSLPVLIVDPLATANAVYSLISIASGVKSACDNVDLPVM